MTQTSTRAGNGRTFHPAVIQNATAPKATKRKPVSLAKQLGLDIEALPFVKSLPEGGRNYWAVKPTGQYGKDCERGRAYARAFFPFLRVNFGVATLGSIVRSMIDAKDESGLVIGFMGEIARATTIGTNIAAMVWGSGAKNEREREARTADWWKNPTRTKDAAIMGTLASDPNAASMPSFPKWPLQEKPDRLADDLQQALADYYALSAEWGPHLLAVNRKMDAQFGHDFPWPLAKSRANQAARNKLMRPHRGVEQRLDRTSNRIEQLVKKIKTRDARGTADFRARALVVLYEMRPSCYDHAGALDFPDDGGATRRLFDAAVEAAGLTDFVAAIEKRLAENARLIAKQKRDDSHRAKKKAAR